MIHHTATGLMFVSLKPAASRRSGRPRTVPGRSNIRRGEQVGTSQQSLVAAGHFSARGTGTIETLRAFRRGVSRSPTGLHLPAILPPAPGLISALPFGAPRLADDTVLRHRGLFSGISSAAFAIRSICPLNSSRPVEGMMIVSCRPPTPSVMRKNRPRGFSLSVNTNFLRSI